MTGQQLKSAILQMAVQGKLVPQNPEDEPASVLVEKIREEKEKLIKEKKIKKEKNPSFIFKGKDNFAYEKFADGSEKCIAEEVPFDIPKNWVWCRLENILILVSGQDLTPEKYNTTTDGIPYITGASNIDNNENVILNRWTTKPVSIAIKDDLLITCKGTIGKMAFLQENKVHIARQIMAIRPILECDMRYIKIVLENLIFHLNSTAKSMIPGISRNDVLKLLLPFPPLAEQKRIVAKIEELEPLIEKYTKAETELNKLNTNFPNQLKKSILQYAIQGKLLPQNPEDEPANILIEKIRAEKQKLIKEKKIKKEKNESIIFTRDKSHYEEINGIERCIDDEIPFEIPDNWAWCRLENICCYIQRGKSPKYSNIKKYPVISQKCNQWNGFFIENAKFIEPDTISNYNEERILQNEDLMWNSTGLGTLGRIAIYKSKLNPHKLAVADSHVTIMRLFKQYVIVKYAYYYIANPTVQNIIEQQADGTTKQKELSLSIIKKYHIPLPPLEEQKRIVSKVNILLKYCEKME